MKSTLPLMYIERREHVVTYGQTILLHNLVYPHQLYPSRSFGVSSEQFYMHARIAATLVLYYYIHVHLMLNNGPIKSGA